MLQSLDAGAIGRPACCFCAEKRCLLHHNVTAEIKLSSPCSCGTMRAAMALRGSIGVQCNPQAWSDSRQGQPLKAQRSIIVQSPNMVLAQARHQHYQPSPLSLTLIAWPRVCQWRELPTCDLGQREHGQVLRPVLHRPCEGGVHGPVVGVVMHSPGTCTQAR